MSQTTAHSETQHHSSHSKSNLLIIQHHTRVVFQGTAALRQAFHSAARSKPSMKNINTHTNHHLGLVLEKLKIRVGNR